MRPERELVNFVNLFPGFNFVFLFSIKTVIYKLISNPPNKFTKYTYSQQEDPGRDSRQKQAIYYHLIHKNCVLMCLCEHIYASAAKFCLGGNQK